MPARKKELAGMECIGMSKMQVKKMPAAEGFVYVPVISALMITWENRSVTEDSAIEQLRKL